MTAVNKILATYDTREDVAVGGLMSYGTDTADMFHQVVVYYRQHPQGRQARRPAGAAIDHI